MSQKVRTGFLIPALLILLGFLIGFPLWMRSPHSFGGQVFAYIFVAILAALLVVGVVGEIGLLIFGPEIVRDWKNSLKR